MRRVGPEETVAEQKRRADHRVADQHDAKPQGADDVHRRHLHRHRAGRAGEGQQPGRERIETKADLQLRTNESKYNRPEYSDGLSDPFSGSVSAARGARDQHSTLAWHALWSQSDPFRTLMVGVSLVERAYK